MRSPEPPPPSPSPQDEYAASRRDSSVSLPPERTLEGTLLHRRGGGQGPSVFKTKMLKQAMRMYVEFDMSDRVGLDFGSLRCYRFAGLSKREANAAYSSTRLGRSGSGSSTKSVRGEGGADPELEDKKQLCLEFPPSLPWTVRDVENDEKAFVVEVSTAGYSAEDEWDAYGCGDIPTASAHGTDGGGSCGGDVGRSDTGVGNAAGEGEGGDGDEGEEEEEEDSEDDEDGVFNFWGDDDDDDDDDGGDDDDNVKEDADTAKEGVTPRKPNQVRLDLARAASRDAPFVRYAFKCPHKKNEKAMWLTAFGRAGRLSSGTSRKKGFFGSAQAALASGAIATRNSRARSRTSAVRARTSRAMERELSASSAAAGGEDEDEDLREYRVRPSYAYPHRWMTHSELTEEMELPSGIVRDLRLRPQVGTRRELGLLQAEVLQCRGLPEQGGSDPNAIVYLVCGSYAFATDVISSCGNPMWLSGVKRACLMPIYHGYARLFAGVFHRDGSKTSSKDAFIGRVAVELARLKPGCTYDVTLPLRLSTGVYSRRKLGAVRLRLTLSKFDTKDILLSYLPHRRNRAATTVACGDPKSFRNVALTVHGKHLPGKFSTEALMATVRELTLVQKSVRRLAKKFVQDLIVWRHPVMSSFAFVGWMHCVRAGSATLAPAYLIGFILLNLVRNYARCIVGQKDFQPMRMEEMLAALMDGSADGGRPIEVEKGTHGGQGGLYLFQTLGLLKSDEYYLDGVDTYTHKEFPFSTLAGYPRFHVEEATKPATTEKLDLDDSEIKEDKADANGDASDTTATNESKRHLSESDQAAYVPRLHFRSPLPEQNIDKKNPKLDKTLTEELQEVNEKAHKFTLHLFADNHPYIITDTTTPPWGRRQQRSEKEGEEYDVKRDLDKILGLGLYSQWNQIMSKFTVQVEPLVGVAEVALCAYRSVYNIFTWRDPFLSFWVSSCFALAIVALLLFPWRAIFFAVGLVALGPQNWIMRKFRELMQSYDSQARPGRFWRAFRELLKSNEGNQDGKERKKLSRRNVAGDYSPQPIFHSKGPDNKATVEGKTIGAQHICVPYSPLLYHRFYDDPDPKYARLLNQMPLDSSTLYAPAHDETITFFPTPPKRIDQPISTKKDVSEEAKNEPQTPVPKAEEVAEEASPVPSATPLPLTETSSRQDAVDLALLQPQITEAVTEAVVTGYNAAKGKAWYNLNKAIAKGGQMKEKLEKTIQHEDEGKDEEIIGLTKQSARVVSMGRRPNMNWLVGKKRNDKSSNQGEENNSACDGGTEEDRGVSEPGGHSSAQNEDQAGNSDQCDKNSSACVSGAEEGGGILVPADEEISTLPAESDSGGNDKGEKETRPDDRSSCTKGTIEILTTHDEEVRATRTDDTVEPAGTSPLMTENDNCDNLKLGAENKIKEEEIKQDGHGWTTEDENPLDVRCQDREEENDNENFIHVEAIVAAERRPRVPSPGSNCASLLEELMTVKLELATSRTENDHYRSVLKETEEELDTYKNKCMQYEKQTFRQLKSPFAKKK